MFRKVLTSCVIKFMLSDNVLVVSVDKCILDNRRCSSRCHSKGMKGRASEKHENFQRNGWTVINGVWCQLSIQATDIVSYLSLKLRFIIILHSRVILHTLFLEQDSLDGQFDQRKLIFVTSGCGASS
ncbi:hypothetical protein NPIL_362591 [Nephila pilipes]|uniref:Uncharacterized protein n=1 Tax=Nephila pilipes TaxID=299642 RepID=A0A8X6P325_NEPPI|nr:hypothetical protein NPIL_362591 [Nephila pilipes]